MEVPSLQSVITKHSLKKDDKKKKTKEYVEAEVDTPMADLRQILLLRRLALKPIMTSSSISAPTPSEKELEMQWRRSRGRAARGCCFAKTWLSCLQMAISSGPSSMLLVDTIFRLAQILFYFTFSILFKLTRL